MKNKRYPVSARALRRLMTLGVSSAGLYCTAQAQTWDGSDSTAWETAANWSTNAVPTTGVVFINTTSAFPNYPVISTGAQTAGELWLGAFSGNPSRLDVTGGTFTVSTRFTIGPDATSIATLNQSNGTVAFTSAANSLNIATGAGTSNQGTYNMSGGTLSSVTYFNVGASGTGTGTFNLSGGTVNAATSTGAVNIGDQGGVTGVLNVSGGTFNSTNTTANGGIVVGNHWTGSGTNNATLTVSGTGIVNTGSSTAGNGIKLGASAGAVGTVNLDGGTIQTAKIQKGAGTGTFNFNGGTLQATAANATYMTGLTNAFVKSGGAVIDTNGFNITVGQALLTDTVSTGGGLTKSGVGTLTLTGVNTYTGTTTISAGTLALGSSGSIASSSTINLGTSGSQGTLDLTAQGSAVLGNTITGYGTINVGGNTLTLTGTLGPGNSPGIITVNGDLELGTTTNMEIVGRNGGAPVAGTDYDQVSVTGSITFAGTLNIDTTGLTGLTNGDTFQLFAAGAYTPGFTSVAMTGAYAPIFTESSDVWTGTDGGLTITFTEATGALSITGTAIPEPGTYAAIFGVLALGISALRRRNTFGRV